MAGHLVIRFARRRSRELICDARTSDGRDVSLVLSRSPSSRRDERARFRRLARLRIDVDNRGLLPVHDWGEHTGMRFLVAAPYPSSTLKDLLRGEPLNPEASLRLLAPVAEALDLCHARGLVHQDLNDESVLLDGERAVLDAFAVGTVGWGGGWESTSAHEFRYGTPEVMRGDPLEPASNIYSFTGLLFHMLTGRTPYGDTPLPVSNTAWAAGLLHATAPPPRPSQHVPELGSEIDEAIAWGMAKEPPDRPVSTVALLRAAAQALRVTAPVTPLPSAPAESARTPATGAPRRRPSAARLSRPAAILAAAAAGVVAGAIAQPFGDDSPHATTDEPDARVIATLGDRRADLRSELADATLPQDQAAAADALASAYRTVAARSHSIALAAAARGAAVAYGELAVSANEMDASRFAEASSLVETAEQRLVAAAASPR